MTVRVGVMYKYKDGLMCFILYEWTGSHCRFKNDDSLLLAVVCDGIWYGYCNLRQDGAILCVAQHCIMLYVLVYNMYQLLRPKNWLAIISYRPIRFLILMFIHDFMFIISILFLTVHIPKL